jgi:uncharacterized protein (DUF1684 family)
VDSRDVKRTAELHNRASWSAQRQDVQQLADLASDCEWRIAVQLVPARMVEPAAGLGLAISNTLFGNLILLLGLVEQLLRDADYSR